MSFDYFYGQQSDLFTFYRVPKVLFTNERFWNISADAKMLYGILLDRMSLSAKNGWIDKNGRVYIIFTIDEAKMALNCAEQKAIKLLSELEKKAGLIERKRQGLGKPNLIYVKNFISAVDSQLLNCENHNSGTMEITTQELPKSQCNNTDIKNTEFSDTDSIFPSGNGGMMDENDRYQEYFDYFSDQLSMDLLKKDYPYDSEMLDNILELIVETVCTKRPLIRIGAEERPAEIVRSRFMKLNAEHIRYVMDCFKENTTKIRNIRQYMLTTIYNAPTTIHILEDEAASRAFIDMMWAEVMFIYQNFPVKLTLSKDMDKELKELQKQFMPEDTKAGLIQSFLDNFKGTQVCSKLIYAEALNHPFDEPKQWEIREINEIMNNSIEGWRPFSNPRSFAKYGRQRGWERIPPPDNEPSATGSNLTDGFRELTEEEARQMELPF